jgi:hypothetical protein
MEASGGQGWGTSYLRTQARATCMLAGGCRIFAQGPGFAPGDAAISGLPGKGGDAADRDDRLAADKHSSNIARLTVEVETRCCKFRRRFRHRPEFVIAANAGDSRHGNAHER